MRVALTVLVAALPLHEARAPPLEPGDSPAEVQVQVAADGTVDAAASGPLPRVELAQNASTTRQVALVEVRTGAAAQAGPEAKAETAEAKSQEAVAAEDAFGKELFKSGRFSWANDNFATDYSKEFVAPDHPQTALVNFLRCLVPHKLYKFQLECMADHLKSAPRVEENTLKDKAEATEFILKKVEESDCFPAHAAGKAYRFGGQKVHEEMKKCMETTDLKSSMEQYRDVVLANVVFYVAHYLDYHRTTEDLKLKGKTDRQIQSKVFHDLFDAHQYFAGKPRLNSKAYSGFHDLLDTGSSARFKAPHHFSWNKFEKVLLWAQLNIVMEILGPAGPIGAEEIKLQLGFDKSLPESAAGMPTAAKALAWPAGLALLLLA